MDPLNVSASIIAVLQLTGTVIQYLNRLKGASKDRQKLLLELSSINSMLFVLQDQAEEAKEDDPWSSTLQSLNLPGGPLAQFQASLETLATKLTPAEGWKRVGKVLTWPLEKDEVYEIVNAIERQKALFNLARQNDHIALSKAIKHDIEALDRNFDEISGSITQVKLAVDRERLCRWLHAPDPSLNYNKAIKDRHPETGAWLVTSESFTRWKTDSNSCLWLYGIPGCGKTILSSTVLEHMLLSYHSSKLEVAVLYFFFDFNDDEKRRHENMVRSLVRQLSMHKSVKTPSKLESLYSSCLHGERQPTLDALLVTLRGMMSAFEETFLIIDALDECMERLELLADIEEIAGWTEINVHIMTTSRKEKVIQESMELISVEQGRISLQSSLVNPDIRAYVRSRLRSDRKLKRWQKEPDVQLEIENGLMSKADGMFRWVACQLDSLGSCFNVPTLRKTLASLPKTLDECYARILSTIDEDSTQSVHKILQWLTLSASPLELQELAEVVAIDVEQHPQFDPDRRFRDIQDILEPCSSLISTIGNAYCIPKVIYLDENGVQYGADDGHSPVYVRLAHFTVKEFLLSPRIREGISKMYSLDSSDSNASIAKDCLAYLLHLGRVESLDVESTNLYPLARYTASNWSKHVQSAEDSTGKVTALIMELLHPEKTITLNNWIRLYNFETFCPEPYINDNDSAHPLYFSSLLGLNQAVKWLLERGADVDARYGAHGNALCAATWEGHQHVVRLLLEAGASVDQPGGHHGNALQTTSWLGNVNLARLFLECGADVNAQGSSGKTALIEAVEAGHEGSVQMLLSEGADVDLRDLCGDTALIKAAQFDYRNIARLLLEAGAEVNIQNISGTSALVEAAGKNHADVARVLLEHGANVDLQSEKGEVALSKAARAGHERVIGQLLSHEAVSDTQIQERMRVMKTVMVEGYKDVVESLLEEMSGPRYIDVQGRSVLHYAAAKGRISTMEVLLKHKADLLGVDKQGRNCLHHAASGGSNRVVEWLLDKQKMDPNNTDRDGWSALHWACRYGSANTIRVLQDAVTCPSLKSIREVVGWTPVLDAAETLKAAAFQQRACIVAHSKINGVTCDGCDIEIFGTWNKCVDCEDFDYCFKCKLSSDDTHPGHPFIENPTSSQFEASTKWKGSVSWISVVCG